MSLKALAEAVLTRNTARNEQATEPEKPCNNTPLKLPLLLRGLLHDSAHSAAADSGAVEPARSLRMDKVLGMLEDHQELRYGLATDLTASPGYVTLTIAIRSVAVFEMQIPAGMYDALRLLELVQLLDPPSSIH